MPDASANNPNPFYQWVCATYDGEGTTPADRVAHILKRAGDDFPRRADESEMYRWFVENELAFDTIRAYEELYEAWSAEFAAKG